MPKKPIKIAAAKLAKAKKSIPEIPATIDKAAALERLIAQKIGEIEKEQALHDAEVRRLEAILAERTEPLREEVFALTAQVYAFAEAHWAELTQGGASKTARILDAGTVEKRTSPHAVKVTDPAATLERLLKLGMFTRQPSPEIDRDAMLADEDSRARAEAIEGISIEQAEKVYVHPAGCTLHVEATLGKRNKPGKWKLVRPRVETSQE